MPLKYVEKTRDLTTQHANQGADWVGMGCAENWRSKKVHVLLTGKLMQGILRILLTQDPYLSHSNVIRTN